jgi:hypothetical protein
MVVQFRLVGQSMERMDTVIMPQSRKICSSRVKTCELDDVINLVAVAA